MAFLELYWLPARICSAARTRSIRGNRGLERAVVLLDVINSRKRWHSESKPSLPVIVGDARVPCTNDVHTNYRAKTANHVRAFCY